MSPTPLTELSTAGFPNGPLAWLCVGALAFFAMVIGLFVARQGRKTGTRWPLLDTLHDLALTTDPRQVTLILRFAVGAFNAVIGVLALNYGAMHGAIEPEGCQWLSATALAVVAALFAVLRSGRNQTFADPSMAEPQLLACVGFLAWGYVLGGVGRPIALLLLFVFLLFNMFTSTMQVLIRASVFATFAFGAAMAYVSLQEPIVALPGGPQPMYKLQLVYFGVLVVMLGSICLMVNFLNQLRAKSSRRKAELGEALARIQDLAMRDELTGLFNRRHMLELLNNEKHRCIRSDRAFCIALIDVDHFKAVNDTHGHNVGDEVLAAVASVISGGLRETDVVARWGGEEFLVMFPDTDSGSAEGVLKRMQLALAAAVMSPQVPQLKVTFSAGVTRYEAEEMLTRTIDRADRALYAAKDAGRNRVVRFDPGQAGPDVPGATGPGASRPSGALENRHAFDMGGMGKHVHRPA